MDPVPELQSLLNDGKSIRIKNYPKKARISSQLEELSFHRYLLHRGLDVTQIDTFITPVNQFFIRNHFEYPEIIMDNWRLKLTGCFEKEAILFMEDLKKFEQVTRICHIECTGNQRSERKLFHSIKRLHQYTNLMTFNLLMKVLDPKQWKWLVSFLRATGIRAGNIFSNGIFTGVRLFDVLKEYPLSRDAKEIVFEGIDKGFDTSLQRVRKEFHHYARSFEIQELQQYEPILCFEMNGAPLTLEHGYPLRLIIPGIYGAEYVKWLGRIIATTEKYKGYFQNHYYGYKIDGEMVPVHEQRPKSMVIKVLKKDNHYLAYGIAWRGTSPIDRIEVSVDDMNTWRPASLLCEEIDHSWVFWRYELPKGLKETNAIIPRVFCINGGCQPLEPGKYSSVYGCNAVVSAVVDL